MTDHNPIPVTGYTPQSDENIMLVNANKEIEKTVLAQLAMLSQDISIDPRMIALAKTSIQQGFMWANRAIMQPEHTVVAAEASK